MANDLPRHGTVRKSVKKGKRKSKIPQLPDEIWELIHELRKKADRDAANRIAKSKRSKDQKRLATLLIKSNREINNASRRQALPPYWNELMKLTRRYPDLTKELSRRLR